MLLKKLSTPPPPTPARPQVQFGMPTIVSNNSGGSGGSNGGGSSGGSGGGGGGGAEDGLYLSVPAFSGMMVNDELSLAILNYKYNNQLLTDNNIAKVGNENFILPTGDPEFKPVKIFDWNKDYSVPNVGLSSLNVGVSNAPFKNVPNATYTPSNQNKQKPINVHCNDFKNVYEALNSSYGSTIDKVINNYMKSGNQAFYKLFALCNGNYKVLKAQIIATIYAESSGDTSLVNHDSDGSTDCGIMQVNTRSFNDALENMASPYKEQFAAASNKCQALINNPELGIAAGVAILSSKAAFSSDLSSLNYNYVNANFNCWPCEYKRRYCILNSMQQYLNSIGYNINTNQQLCQDNC